jgi:hypothetical protein
VPQETIRLQQQHGLTEVQSERLQEQIEAQMVLRNLDESIDKFSDKDPDIQRRIAEAAPYFGRNPRELKRFVNAFRLHHFLWYAAREQGVQVPTKDQLWRWTVLSMKWPEVVRWLRRGGGSDLWTSNVASEHDTLALTTRLKLIEVVSGEAADLASWQQGTHKTLRLTPDAAPWLNDDELFQFFHREDAQPEGQRLSDGVGKGLW